MWDHQSSELILSSNILEEVRMSYTKSKAGRKERKIIENLGKENNASRKGSRQKKYSRGIVAG